MKQAERIYLGVLIAAFLIVGPMFAARASAADKNPCAQDIAKFCKDVKPDFRSIMACLEEHENELSDACKTHEAKMGGRRMEVREEIRERVKFRKACNDDIVKLCKDADPAGGGVVKCLQQHEKELSAPCGERLKALLGEKNKPE